MKPPKVIEVLVQDRSSTWATQTVRGRRATSTVSAGQAMQRLHRKLHGHEGDCTRLEDGPGWELWQMAAPGEPA